MKALLLVIGLLFVLAVLYGAVLVVLGPEKKGKKGGAKAGERPPFRKKDWLLTKAERAFLPRLEEAARLKLVKLAGKLTLNARSVRQVRIGTARTRDC